MFLTHISTLPLPFWCSSIKFHYLTAATLDFCVPKHMAFSKLPLDFLFLGSSLPPGPRILKLVLTLKVHKCAKKDREINRTPEHLSLVLCSRSLAPQCQAALAAHWSCQMHVTESYLGLPGFTDYLPSARTGNPSKNSNCIHWFWFFLKLFFIKFLDTYSVLLFCFPFHWIHFTRLS